MTGADDPHDEWTDTTGLSKPRPQTRAHPSHYI